MDSIPVEEGKTAPDMLAHTGKQSNVEIMSQNCGLRSRFIIKKPLEIHTEALPLIAFMKDGSTVILEENSPSEDSVLCTDANGETLRISKYKFAEEADETVLLLKKELKIDESIGEKKRNKWFFDAVWLSKFIYLDVIAASLFINLFGIVTPLFTMNVYDRIVPNHAVESLWALAVGVITVFCFDAVLKYMRHHFLEISAKKTDLLLSGRMFRKVMDLNLSDRPKVIGSFASNLKDFDMIRNFLSSSTVSLLVDLPFMIIFLVLIAYIAGFIVVIPISVIIILLMYALIIRKPINALVTENYNVSSKKNGMLIESLKTLETIKSFNFHKHKMWEWDNIVSKAAYINKSLKGLSYSMNTFFNFMVNLTTVSVVITGVYLISELELTTGGLIAAVMLSSRAVAPVGQAISLITSYDQAKVAFKGIDDIMQKESETIDSSNLLNIEHIKGSIAFRNVSFKYHEEGAYALKNVSFTVQPGEKVAILGKMGSGKSTLQKLIMGFFHPTDGEVLIDGISVSQINPVMLRDNISYVSQNVELFRGTMKQNLCIRKTDASDQEIVNAVNIAGLSGFINRHPQGLAAEIAEDGHNLSGGQKQSITIARAFIGDSSIALMDEPTDGIDHNTEMAVIHNLRQVLKDKTLFLITHKNSLLDLVDRVILLEDGGILFDGSKEEMFKRFSKVS